jgi:hypothetical protein
MLGLPALDSLRASGLLCIKTESAKADPRSQISAAAVKTMQARLRFKLTISQATRTAQAKSVTEFNGFGSQRKV